MGKFFRYDLKNGILSRRMLFLPLVFLPILFGTALSVSETPAFFDAVLYHFKGMAPFSAQGNDSFAIPFEWLLFQLYTLFLTAAYPTADLNGSGIQLLVRAEKRRRFWLSKCVWNLTAVGICYLLYWCGAALSVVFLKGSLFGAPDAQLALRISGMAIEGVSLSRLSFLAFLLPFLSTAALSQIQQALTLWIKPIPAYVAAVAILAASAFWATPFLIGNHSMLLRSLRFGRPEIAAGADLLLMLGFAAAGTFRLKRYDILG